jgi:hypothetical protein
MTIARRDLFPSGPVSAAASVQVCAGFRNANYLEIPDRPGFGVALNEDVIRTRALPL